MALSRYELKLKDESSAVVQLGLNYSLTYTQHHSGGHEPRTASLTQHPSSEAREFIRQQLLQYAQSSRTEYRFIDYFAIVGSANPRLLFSQPDAASAHSAAILCRYPDDDRSDVQLPDEIAMFAFPDSFTLSAEQHREQLFSFRLSQQPGTAHTRAHPNTALQTLLRPGSTHIPILCYCCPLTWQTWTWIS